MKSWMYVLFSVFVIGSLVSVSGAFEQVVSGFLPSAQFARHMFGGNYHDIYKEQDRSKIIKFNHKYHMTDVGAECSQCHGGVESSTKSSESFLPKMADCYQCHDEKSTACSTCHVETAEPYTKLVAAKRELVFSHDRHIKDGVTCETCHAGILSKEDSKPGVLPSMETCNTCHDGSKASSECATCHTDIRFILPKDHSADWIRQHHLTVASQGDANCIMCHSQASCQECHEGGSLEKFKGQNDFRTARSPSGVSNGRSQVLQSVHKLDYLFTHRFDSKAKTKDCQTCHETESFCQQCHSGNDKVSMPAWHSVAGFAVANTGGTHTILAKKDLENCVTCHDLSAPNKTCMKPGCHTF